MTSRKDSFEPERYYHVYNRSVGNELLFHYDKNYIYFLEKYQKYISSVADTLAYCLLPNHFHFLIRLKDEMQVFSHTGNRPTRFSKPRRSSDAENYSKHISQYFSNLFNPRLLKVLQLSSDRFFHLLLLSLENIPLQNIHLNQCIVLLNKQ